MSEYLPRADELDIESEGWPDRHYSLYKEAIDSNDFLGAFHCAFESAIIGSNRFSASHNPEDLYHRALFYGLAAIAANRAGSKGDLLDMYFMTRLVLEEVGPISAVQSLYLASFQDLEKELTQLGNVIRSLGIDPDHDPRVFMRTRIYMDAPRSGDT